MAYIYKITNNINNKIYIGKTNLTIEKRFKEHCRDAFREKNEKRPLYAAMRKYGIQNFSIEEVEECLDTEASIREIYWIGYYKSFENGYNATFGGDGKNFFNHFLIAEELKKNPYPLEIAKQFNCSSDTVYIVAKEFNISVKSKGILNVNEKKEIFQFDKQENFLQSFESAQAAGDWCVRQGLSKNRNCRSHISECARGERKTAFGYVWKYK